MKKKLKDMTAGEKLALRKKYDDIYEEELLKRGLSLREMNKPDFEGLNDEEFEKKKTAEIIAQRKVYGDQVGRDLMTRAALKIKKAFDKRKEKKEEPKEKSKKKPKTVLNTERKKEKKEEEKETIIKKIKKK
tara:strand:+ start:463 stop:858 length:396 start_codon:yes stop_codon:yes gene_type:complete